MRLTPEQIRERFEREVTQLNLGLARGAEWQSMLACALRLAADLQAPPTGEEAAKEDLAEERLHGAIASVIYAIRTRSRNVAALETLHARLSEYGAACRAAGRAEAGKAAEVLTRLEAIAKDCIQVKLTVIVGHVSGQSVIEANTDCCDKPDVHAEGDTMLDAIAAALDQLAAEVKP